MTLTVGKTANLGGDVSRLNAVGARPPSIIEKMLGYEPGRLSHGFFIALLKEPLRSNHVHFGGLTLRSGGREGLPKSDPSEDKKRKHNHDQMLADYGDEAVVKLLAKLACDSRNLIGNERIVKVVPVTRHTGYNPAKEYPPGGGAPQYTLLASHTFFIAVEISPNAIALTAQGWSVPVGNDAPYEARSKLIRYLQTLRLSP